MWFATSSYRGWQTTFAVVLNESYYILTPIVTECNAGRRIIIMGCSMLLPLTQPFFHCALASFSNSFSPLSSALLFMESSEAYGVLKLWRFCFPAPFLRGSTWMPTDGTFLVKQMQKENQCLVTLSSFSHLVPYYQQSLFFLSWHDAPAITGGEFTKFEIRSQANSNMPPLLLQTSFRMDWF